VIIYKNEPSGDYALFGPFSLFLHLGLQTEMYKALETWTWVKVQVLGQKKWLD